MIFPNISAKINANDPDGDNLAFAIANGTNDTTQQALIYLSPALMARFT